MASPSNFAQIVLSCAQEAEPAAEELLDVDLEELLDQVSIVIRINPVSSTPLRYPCGLDSSPAIVLITKNVCGGDCGLSVVGLASCLICRYPTQLRVLMMTSS